MGVLNLFDGINEFYLDNYGLGYLDNSGDQVYGGRSAGEMLGAVVVLLVILLVIASVLDSMRYASYRQRYYGVPNPPYVFRPILFWHGPGWGWYRRRCGGPLRLPPEGLGARAAGPAEAASTASRGPAASAAREEAGAADFPAAPAAGASPGAAGLEAASAVPAGAASAAAPAEEDSPVAAASGAAPGAADLAAGDAPEGYPLITVHTETDRAWLRCGPLFIFEEYKTDIPKYKILLGVEILDIPGTRPHIDRRNKRVWECDPG